MTTKTEETATDERPEIVRMTVLCPKDLHDALWRARVGSQQGRKMTLSAFMVDAARERLDRLAAVKPAPKATHSAKRRKAVR